MSVSTAPKQDTTPQASRPVHEPGLTLRSFFVCIFALFLMGAWIEYHECIAGQGAPLAENSPPTSAIGVILGLVIISALLYRFHRSLRLSRAELIFIYAALLVAAPLMTQGMWHRFVGIITAIPHTQDFKSYESLPPQMWPHGPNLIPNGQFVDKLEHFNVTGPTQVVWKDIEWKKQQWKCPEISGVADPTQVSSLSVIIPRKKDGKDQLIPGEMFLFSTLVKTDELKGANYSIRMRVDEGRWKTLQTNTSPTSPSFANPSGLTRVGVAPLIIPDGLKENLSLAISVNGPGKVLVHDMQLINYEAVEGMYGGVGVVRQKDVDTLNDNEKAFLIVKPDNMFSLAGLRYLLKGLIPWDQWAQTFLAWTILIGSLFAGFMGMNVLLRRQWVEHERFTFPMNIIPRQLLTTEESGANSTPIYRNRIMWIGFIITLPLILLRGIHFYYPSIPSPLNIFVDDPGFQLAPLFSDPVLKAFFQNINIHIVVCIFAVTLLVETDILFSIWVTFFLFQLLNVFGRVFSLTNTMPGYPWQFEQSVGAYIGYALLAIFAARKHLLKVFLHVIGKKPMDDTQEIMRYRTALFLVLLAVAGIIAWGIWLKAGALACFVFFGWMLVCGFTASKIRAEAGMGFGYWAPYFGMVTLSALGGFAVFGTSGMMVATAASGFMLPSCFIFIAPAQVEMMELGRTSRVRPRDIGIGLTIGLLAGLFIGGFVLLSYAYGKGSDNLQYNYPYTQSWYYDGYKGQEQAIDGAYKTALDANKQTEGHVSPKQLMTPESAPMNIKDNLNAKGIVIGVLVTCLFGILRSVFMWFPLHPLGYVLATTYFAKMFWAACFLGWLIRLVVLRIGGAHSIRKGLIPFAMGMVLACVTYTLFWEAIGIYLRANGVTDIFTSWP